MASKFLRTAQGTSYAALDASINSEALVTIMNDSGVVLRFTTATDGTNAAAEDSAGRFMQMASSASVIWKFRCNPSTTFVKTETGGANPRIHIDY